MEILEIGMLVSIVTLLIASMIFFYFAVSADDHRESEKAFFMSMVCTVGWGILGITGSILFN